MRIAICDDCREDAMNLRSFLEGHQTKLFSGGGELLADLNEQHSRYDLYLLDIYMESDINGIQL